MPTKWSFGVLNDRIAEDVPGTILLLPEHAYSQPDQQGFSNKDDDRALPNAPERKTVNGIVLHPKPDDTPNDPLNWPLWRRNAALMALGIFCMLGGGMTPVLAAGFFDVAETYRVPVAKIALTTGFFMTGLGVGSVLVSPTAILFGKRPMYLGCAFLSFFATVWCAMSPNYTSLVAARVVQGISLSPVECLASSTITEIFFLHERAFRLGIYTLVLLSGKNLIPLASAVIVQSLGWRAVFRILAIVIAVCFLLILFLLPESYWDRSPKASNMNSHVVDSMVDDGEKSKTEKNEGRLPSISAVPASTPPTSSLPSKTETTTHGGSSPLGLVDAAKGEVTQLENAPQPQTELESDGSYTEYWRSAPRRTFTQSLKPFPGRLSHDKWHLVAIRPFILFAYPSILWSALIYSLCIGWLIVLSESVSSVYRDRYTYNFTSFQVGLVYLSPFVGSVLGTALTGMLSDFAVKFMARRNGGVFEPEFRLVMAIPVAISSVIGLMGFGWSVDAHDNYIVPTIFFGIISFGCSLGSSTAITFCVDSYRQYSGEALVTLNFSKNIFHGLVFSLFFPEWLEKDGNKKVFLILGVIQLGGLLLTIPMFIYGKRARAWTVRKDFMRRF